jgi:hypothetical protein
VADIARPHIAKDAPMLALGSDAALPVQRTSMKRKRYRRQLMRSVRNDGSLHSVSNRNAGACSGVGSTTYDSWGH